MIVLSLQRKTHFYLIGIFILLVSCSESRTTDANESYARWSGKKATSDLKIYQGQYSQTGGLFKEYTLFLELEPSDEWRDQFFKDNELIADDESWSLPEDAPAWFNPDKNCKRWKSPQPFAESLYLQDPASGILFIYEVQ
jgi:hypothetical protein